MRESLSFLSLGMTIVDMTSQPLTLRQRWPIWSASALVAALPFSYYPLVSFGTAAGMHLDGSLLYLIIAMTLIVSFPSIWRNRFLLLRSRALQLLLALCAFSFASVTWSTNPMRGIVTSLFLLMLIGVVCLFAIQTPTLNKYRHVIYRIATVSVGISVAWASWQIFADALGIDSAFTLLSQVYSSAVFGVARPTGFALEPQFLGSLLLIPFFWLACHYLKDAHTKALYAGGIIAVGTTILLTLSRGAIYAAVIGIILLFVLQRAPLKRCMQLIGISLLSLLMSSVFIFSAATINQRDSIDGYSSLAKAINHLSLGVVSLPSATPSSPAEQTSQKQTSGYIAASTDSRVSMSAQAVSLWTATPPTILFGIGAGSFGSSLHAKDNHYPASSIVNNYYLEILAETGLVGLGLFLSFIGTLLYGLFRARKIMVSIILISLLFQALFFSGNANAVHLWVIFGVGLGLTLHTAKKTSRLVQLN